MIRDKVFRFNKTEVPRQAGEFARLRVIKGPDVGATFVVKESTFTLGRGETVDIILADPKSSRNHARIDFTHEGWVVSDLGSANGIFYNGEFVRKFSLKSGDHFTIGESILEFLMSRESDRALLSPLKASQEVDRLDAAFAQQKVRVKNVAKPVQVAAPASKKDKRSPLPLVLVLLGVSAYLYPEQSRPILEEYGLGFLAEYLPETPSAPKGKGKGKGKGKKNTQDGEKADPESRDLASLAPDSVPKEIEKTAEQHFALGFREYTAGNYLRAKEAFELALQVNPNHGKARYYLANAEHENREEIRKIIEAARIAREFGRTRKAIGLYETAIRHLYFDRENPQYVECESALKELKKMEER
jgi:pSer/pThr/pTyr-binding forkhead associated (FHA) protein